MTRIDARLTELRGELRADTGRRTRTVVLSVVGVFVAQSAAATALALSTTGVQRASTQHGRQPRTGA